MAECKAQLARGVKRSEFKRTVKQIVEDFDTLPLVGEGTKPRVGVVGEILVKFHPTANNQIVDVIEREGCEAVVPGLIEFFPIRHRGRHFPERPAGPFRQGRAWWQNRAIGHREVPQTGQRRARRIDALQPAGGHLRAGRLRERDPFPVQLDGRGVAAHR